MDDGQQSWPSAQLAGAPRVMEEEDETVNAAAEEEDETISAAIAARAKKEPRCDDWLNATMTFSVRGRWRVKRREVE